MNIILPMAGDGSRFVKAGFQDPKPFIPIGDNRMIDLVVKNISSNGDNIIFIAKKQHLENDKYKNILKGKTITIDKTTEGAAITVSLAFDHINLDQELLVANSDQLILDENAVKNGIEYFRKHNADGGIFTFWADHPKWSYCRINGGLITEVVEKQVISNFATCGVYYFKRGQYLKDAIDLMVSKNFRVNGEFYLAPSYNFMLLSNKKIVPYFVNELVGLGTPEDYNKYIDSLK